MSDVAQNEIKIWDVEDKELLEREEAVQQRFERGRVTHMMFTPVFNVDWSVARDANAPPPACRHNDKKSQPMKKQVMIRGFNGVVFRP